MRSGNSFTGTQSPLFHKCGNVFVPENWPMGHRTSRKPTDEHGAALWAKKLSPRRTAEQKEKQNFVRIPRFCDEKILQRVKDFRLVRNRSIREVPSYPCSSVSHKKM